MQRKALPHSCHQCRVLVPVRRKSRRGYDLIGPPDVTSNIPTFKLKETNDPLELQLQSMRRLVWQYNHSFWSKHNDEFQQQKKLFIAQKITKEKKVVTKVTSEELSQFYKEFLDNKYSEHMKYNREWLKLISKLTFFTLKIWLFQILQKFYDK